MHQLAHEIFDKQPKNLYNILPIGQSTEHAQNLEVMLMIAIASRLRICEMCCI